MRGKILAIGIVLAVVGALLLATTLYQEEVAPPPEIPHMEIPSAKYEWRTRNIVLTTIGANLIGVGLVAVVVGATKKEASGRLQKREKRR